MGVKSKKKPPNYCSCGCGELIPAHKKFKRGHNVRMPEYWEKWRKKRGFDPHLCHKCGRPMNLPGVADCNVPHGQRKNFGADA